MEKSTMTNEQDKQHLQELAAYRFTVENLRALVAELEAKLEAAQHTAQAAVPVGWMNADTLRAMQDTPKSEKTRWPLYTIGEYASKEGMIPVYAATHPTQQGMEQDAARYQALVESGNFAPSTFENGMWGLRASSAPSTKSELDAAVDRVLAAQAKQGDNYGV